MTQQSEARSVPRSQRPGILERTFVVFAFIVLSGAFFQLLDLGPDGVASAGEGQVAQAVLLSVYAATVVMFVKCRAWKFGLKLDRSVVILTLFAVFSVLWSIQPSLTLLSSLELVPLLMFVKYLTSRFSILSVVRLLSFAIALTAVASVAVGLLYPEYGISVDVAAAGWRGVFTHKNVLGRVMALGVILSGALFFYGRRFQSRYLVQFVFCFYLVVVSQSKTAWVALAVIGALVPIGRLLPRHDTTQVVAVLSFFVIGLAIALVWTSSNLGTATGAVGEEATLTGRTALWAAARDAIDARPLSGFGLHAFWSLSGGPFQWPWAETWQPFHAHNGFLDLTLSLGLPGLIIFIAGAAGAIRNSFVSAREYRYFLLPLIGFFLAINTAETAILRDANIFWALYIYCATVAQWSGAQVLSSRTASNEVAVDPASSQLLDQPA